MQATRLALGDEISAGLSRLPGSAWAAGPVCALMDRYPEWSIFQLWHASNHTIRKHTGSPDSGLLLRHYTGVFNYGPSVAGRGIPVLGA